MFPDSGPPDISDVALENFRISSVFNHCHSSVDGLSHLLCSDSSETPVTATSDVSDVAPEFFAILLVFYHCQLTTLRALPFDPPLLSPDTPHPSVDSVEFRLVIPLL